MATGIIAEYNPFHNGHIYQIEEVKKIVGGGGIVAIMSGSFTQRGTPAILDKFKRAALAISGGCNLVLELPFVFATGSAETFAGGGIKILKNIGVIDRLAFGAEISDLSKLQAAANIFEEKDFAENLREKMKGGRSYASAVAKILSQGTGLDEKNLSRPNNILAVEYLKALPPEITPILIPRIGAEYDDKILRENFSSAAAVRAAVYAENPAWQEIARSVNSETLAALQAAKTTGLPDENLFFLPAAIKFLTSHPDEVREILGMTEGLEHLLAKTFGRAKNFAEVIAETTSRRYPSSRIRRLILHFLIGLKSAEFEELKSGIYARVLAFDERGRSLLKKMKATSEIPIVSKVAKHLNKRDFSVRRRELSPYQRNLMFDVIADFLRISGN